MPPPSLTVGSRVLRRRTSLGMTQQDLAARCDCAVSTISKIEQRGHCRLSQRLLERLSATLGISIDELVMGSKQAWKTARAARKQ